MEKEGIVHESFWKLFFAVYKKCKEQVNLFLLVLASIFTFFSSSLEAISLGLIIPILETVLNNKPSELGVVQKALDFLSITEIKNVIIAVAVAIFVAVIFKNFFSYASGWLTRYVNNNISHTLRTKVMKTYLQRDFLFFEKNRVGDLNYMLGLSGVFSSIINQMHGLIRNAFFCFCYAVVMVYISPMMSLFIILAFLPLYFVIKWLKHTIERVSSLLVKVGSELSIKTYEILSSIHLIKLCVAEDKEGERYEKLSKKTRNLSNGLGNRTSLISNLQEPIMTLGVIILAGVSYFYFFDGTKGGIAGFMTFFVILRRFQWELQGLVSRLPLFAQNKPNLKKFLLVFDEKPWMIIKSGKKQFTKLKKNIEFKNLYFKYDDKRDYVLKNINMTIEKGKITALVGPSGAGKTTIAELIPRIFDCKEGKILVDGADIKQYNIHSLRKKIGVVSQDIAILGRTIKENICYGLDREVSDKELIEVTKEAGLYGFIMTLPDKFETMLGERGINLSGGQRQRVSIARAIFKDPDLLILDEATSALDTETERRIQQALDKILKGRTAIAIAHRLSTIENADKIVVIENGKISEQGTFKGLLKKKGRFYHYWKLQTEF